MANELVDETIDAARWVAKLGLGSTLTVVFLALSTVGGILIIGIQYVPPTASFGVALGKGTALLVPTFEAGTLVPNTFFGALLAGFVGGACALAVHQKISGYLRL